MSCLDSTKQGLSKGHLAPIPVSTRIAGDSQCLHHQRKELHRAEVYLQFKIAEGFQGHISRDLMKGQ